MTVLHWSALTLLAISAASIATAQASSQAESDGFVEGSTLNVLNRNYYLNADNRSGNFDDQSYFEEWAHGLIGSFESGFTQGTVGVGVDAIALLGIRLDSGRGRSGTGLLPLDSDGRAEREFSQMGAAVKLRLSDTVLKVGDQLIELPVFTVDDGRLLPEVAHGILITSDEAENLQLNAGRITGLSEMFQTSPPTAPGCAQRNLSAAPTPSTPTWPPLSTIPKSRTPSTSCTATFSMFAH